MPAAPPTPRPQRPKPSDLLPIDWDKIEPHYRAGILSLSAIARKFGTTKQAISQKAKTRGWTRSLHGQIHARADQLVDSSTAKGRLDGETVVVNAVEAMEAALQHPDGDRQVVEANAQALALIRMAHREQIGQLRRLIGGLLKEVTHYEQHPELYAMVYDALDNPNEPAIEALREMARVVSSAPVRTKLTVDLSTAMQRCIAMEREAFSMSAADGTDGRPLVIIKDYTGRGDPDSPRARAAALQAPA